MMVGRTFGQRSDTPRYAGRLLMICGETFGSGAQIWREHRLDFDLVDGVGIMLSLNAD